MGLAISFFPAERIVYVHFTTWTDYSKPGDAREQILANPPHRLFNFMCMYCTQGCTKNDNFGGGLHMNGGGGATLQKIHLFFFNINILHSHNSGGLLYFGVWARPLSAPPRSYVTDCTPYI